MAAAIAPLQISRSDSGRSKKRLPHAPDAPHGAQTGGELRAADGGGQPGLDITDAGTAGDHGEEGS